MWSYLSALWRVSPPTGGNSFPRPRSRRTIYIPISVIDSGRLGRILITGSDSTTARHRWRLQTHYALTSTRLSVGGLPGKASFCGGYDCSVACCGGPGGDLRPVLVIRYLREDRRRSEGMTLRNDCKSRQHRTHDVSLTARARMTVARVFSTGC